MYYPSGTAPRGRQAEASSSLSCPLLLRSGVLPVVGGSAREPEGDISPASSVLSSPYSPYPPHPLRSRSGGSHRDVDEEDEPTFPLSRRTRRALALQEAYKKVRDRKRRRRESEEAELDEYIYIVLALGLMEVVTLIWMGLVVAVMVGSLCSIAR